MKFTVFVSLFLSTQLSLAAWDLNDVSYLMPLPARLGTDSLLRMTDRGQGGEILPADMIQKIPVLAIDRPKEEIAANMRVVAVRVDPCFPLPTPQSCQRQVRLVWQPLEITRRKTIEAVDAALHAFYVLDDQQFSSVLKDLEAWKKKFKADTKFKPLQVHPAWAGEGDSSPALIAFNKVILKHIGPNQVNRVTAMVLRGNGDMWAFAGFDMRDGQLDMSPVPRLGNRKSQSFVNLAVPADHFSGGGIAPSAKGEDTLANLVGESDKITTGMEELIRRETRAAFRIENPKHFNPENMDCVSCHVAQPALQWIGANRPELKVKDLWSKEVYTNSKYDMSNTSPDLGNTRTIRAFGYFDQNVAISQRVSNESAEVADLVNQYLAGKKK